MPSLKIYHTDAVGIYIQRGLRVQWSLFLDDRHIFIFIFHELS